MKQIDSTRKTVLPQLRGLEENNKLLLRTGEEELLSQEHTYGKVHRVERHGDFFFFFSVSSGNCVYHMRWSHGLKAYFTLSVNRVFKIPEIFLSFLQNFTLD